ncbi:MAG: ATP-dependent DNA helicase RecG [Dehalococcoidia bacterium]|nr:ATP-dependent DNA helicase RecG [Dehalococcoidia bacterium]
MTRPAPALDYDRLRRVFELELERGCTNDTVLGGLDGMLVRMAEDGLPIGAFRREVARLPAAGYRSLLADARRIWLLGAVSALAADGRPTRAAPPPAASSLAPPKRPGRRAPRPPSPAGSSSSRLTRESPASHLPGVGRAAAARLEKLGVRTAGDAALFFPRRFNDFTDLRPIADLQPTSTPQTIVATVESVRETRFGRRVRGAEALLRDRSGVLRVAWFNMPYVARTLVEGQRLVVSGKVRRFRGRLQMENPEFEPLTDDDGNAGRLVPVYPATQGVSQRTLRRAVLAAVDALAADLPDPIPVWVGRDLRLSSLPDAVRTLHLPSSFAAAEEARRRLALGEFLAIQCAVLLRRAEWQRGRTAPALALGAGLDAFLGSLPFALTPSQRGALDEILTDLRGPYPMLRLLQGDVGSGKTVIAFAAMLAAVVSGGQAVLMAPTELRAEQHYRSRARLLGGDDLSPLAGLFAPSWLGRSVRALLLTGSLTSGQKEQVRADAAYGGADLVVGTHALLEEGVDLPRLGLAVVDEQHRFGVMQRARLRRKGANPHLLVMTATPIPRTLALTVYGDLEVSTIDELPPGRKPVRTVWVQPQEREEAYQFIREHLEAGEQAFVICPLVQESEALDVRSAEEEFARLRHGPLARYRLDLLHGRMPGRQKDEIMERFARHEADVLVSNSVIEVGIDVPNATVIVIEGAERFGLSQLHQFRGRVGRSSRQSYCMLFSTEDDPGPDARERLEAMVSTSDGFRLAEVDLELRGEGEAWGRLQSGANTMLRVARLTDRDILARARELAADILARDPALSRTEHRALADAVQPFLARATEAN